MRVGLFTDAYLPDINGVVSSVATLKKALEDLGHTVFVISNHKGTKISFEDHILRLPGLEVKKFYGYKMSSPLQFRADAYIEKMDLDVVHIQTEAGIGMYGRQMAKKLHIPIVYTYHTLYEDYTHYINPLDFDSIEKLGKSFVRTMSRVLANGSQAVIAPSEKTKQALIQYGVIAPIYIVPTGLDLSEYDRKNLDEEKIQSIRNEFGFTKDDHVVVFVGRIAKEKAIEIPIEAVSLSKDEHLRLVIVGGGTDMNYYQEYAKKLGVSDRVYFTGKIDKSQIAYYYAAFDCFVSASLSETQGMTYIEALASGLLVFGRRDEVLKDLIDEGKSGYYFDDAKELEEKWNDFFSRSIEERNDLREYCVSKTALYTEDMFAHKALSVYSQAIDDYSKAYRVESIKMQDDFIRLTVIRDCDAEPKKVMIPVDDFFELKIMKNTMLDAYLIDNYLDMQLFYKAYEIMKKRVLSKDYTSRQMIEYGMKQLNLEEDQSKDIVHALEERNWINDEQYALDKASYWHSYGQGKIQIKNKLKKAGIGEEYIDEALSGLKDETEKDNALRFAKRLTHSLKEQSLRMQRKTLLNKLVAKGYSLEVAKEVSEAIELDGDDEDALKRTVQKAKRLYATFEDSRRKEKIISYCVRKGFSISDIKDFLEGDVSED